MTNFDFCRVCRVPRYVEGFKTYRNYIEAGWVKEEFTRWDNTGDFYIRVEWQCPDCRKKEVDAEKRKDEEWQKLRKRSMENDPTLYERIMKERAS